MDTRRTKNSVYNSIANLLTNISVTVLSFIVRTIFIKELGQQCLGLDGLFLNILSLLSLSELGFSTAISFSLYEPLAKNNTKKVNQIIIYLKKVYRNVAILIFILGMLILPFLNIIAKGYTIDYNIYIIYILYLLNTVFSYFTSYSITLIDTDQKMYKTAIIKLIFNVLVYSLQVIIILLTKNFVLYLLIQLAFRQLERVITHFYIKNQYKEIDFSSNDKLPYEEKVKIKNNIKDLLLYKIGGYAVNGTDNILISSIINISLTGIYSNYLSIISIMRNLIGSVIYATTASFGNLNVTEGEKTKKNVFEIINFICYFAAGFVVVGLFFCINPFIALWIGKNYTLNIFCVIVICINFYLDCIMIPITSVKNSVGLYHVDRYIQVIRAIINLAVSIFLGIKIGMIGILLGTCISAVLTVNVVTPYVVYKHIFKSSTFHYFKKILKNIVCIVVAILVGTKLLPLISVNTVFLQFLTYGIISTILYILIFILVNFYTSEFEYVVNMCIKILKRKEVK